MPKIISNPVNLIVSPNSLATENWMYFKGNGHTSGRNGPYDGINVQRYFYIPTVEAGIDTLKWVNGFSVSWQFIPVRQAGYYTTFFYSASEGTNFYDLISPYAGGSNCYGYVGCHPYPYSAFGTGGEDFTRHKWEISVDGGDYVSAEVSYGQKFTQAFRCNVLNKTSGQSALRFYTDITGPNSLTQIKSETIHQGSYANSLPHPKKAMVFGNAPWWRAHQHERLSGFVRRIKIFAGEISDDDLLLESLSDQLVTAKGRELIWWAKINPNTPDDLLSDFATSAGIKRQALWIDSAKCQIVNSTQLPTHHAFVNASVLTNSLHWERG